MAATRLTQIRLEKPWGRHELWPGFANPEPQALPVGEIWFDHPADRNAPLLVKYLFTSERLSIQVHPDNDAARTIGYPCGKDEAWIILDAEPGATIALGTKRTLSKAELRHAAMDGSIAALVDWKPVVAGDVIFAPAGTIHAIGAGITLIEIQQNVDLTYRLYDYGRPRELHLDLGIAAADPRPFASANQPAELAQGRNLIVESHNFCIERWHGDMRHDVPETGKPIWLVCIAGTVKADDIQINAGECWIIEGSARISARAGADLLVAYPGNEAIRINP